MNSRTNLHNEYARTKKRVSFTSVVSYKIIPVIDPCSKADLYYSREEMMNIKIKFQRTVALYRQMKLQQKMAILLEQAAGNTVIASVMDTVSNHDAQREAPSHHNDMDRNPQIQRKHENDEPSTSSPQPSKRQRISRCLERSKSACAA